MNTNSQIEAYANGKVVGTTSSKDSMFIDDDGQLRPMFRSVSIGKNPDVVDLRDKKISSDGCGGARVESFAGGGGTPVTGGDAGDGLAGR